MHLTFGLFSTCRLTKSSLKAMTEKHPLPLGALAWLNEMALHSRAATPSPLLNAVTSSATGEMGQ